MSGSVGEQTSHAMTCAGYCPGYRGSRLWQGVFRELGDQVHRPGRVFLCHLSNPGVLVADAPLHDSGQS